MNLILFSHESNITEYFEKVKEQLIYEQGRTILNLKKDDKCNLLVQELTIELEKHINISRRACKIFYLDENKIWQPTNVNLSKFKKTMIHFFKSIILNYSIDKMIRDMMVDVIEIFLTKEDYSSNIIQFKDCYLDTENKKVVKGRYSEDLPRAFVEFEVYDSVMKGEPTEVVPEVDELLLHLVNGQGKDALRLTEQLGMLFVLDRTKIQQYGVCIRFTGYSGKNGKSTICKYIREIFDDNCCMSCSIADLKGFFLPDILEKLVVFDEDATDVVLSEEASSNFKKIVLSDFITARRIHSNPEQYAPMTKIIIASNSDMLTADKSGGMSRRIDNYLIRKELKRNENWFVNLKSDKGRTYFVQKLLLAALNILKNDNFKYTKESEEKAKVTKDLTNKNNPVLEFIEEFDVMNKLPIPVKELYEEFEEYSELNGTSHISPRRFNSIIESNLPVTRQTVRANTLTGRLANECEISGIKVVKCWVNPQF